MSLFFLSLPKVYFSGKLHNEKKTSFISDKNDDISSVYKEIETGKRGVNIRENLKVLCGNYVSYI